MKKWKSIIVLVVLVLFVVLTGCPKADELVSGDDNDDGDTGGVITTEVGGIIDTDTMWSGKIQLTSDLIVSDGATLTIDDNTSLYVYSNYTMWIYGDLIAEGENITICSSCDEFYIRCTNNENIKLSNVVMTNGQFSCFGAVNFTLSDCVVSDFGICISPTLGVINNVDFNRTVLQVMYDGTVNIDSCDFVNSKSVGYDFYAIYGGDSTTINLNNCYIASNNGSTIVATSTTVPDDPDSPQQYYGVTSITAPRSTPNF